jgi:hypothetical protein
MKKTLKIDDKLEYEFDDEAEFQGKTFISFKKISEFNGQKKYQNLTCKQDHWSEVKEWLNEIIMEIERNHTDGDGDAPF